jgi:putative ABC transport system ATP-binding protein
MQTIIKANNIIKKYNNIPVIKDVSLEVKKGDFLSIVGNSGAGKSTLLYLLSGIEKIDSGRVLLFDIDISIASDTEMAKLRSSKIAFVFQFDNLFQDLSILDNIILPGIIAGKKKEENEKKATELMRYFDIEKISKSKPSEVSGGEQQRASIARALITQPEILFLDEPTGSLNSEAGTQIMELLKKLNKDFSLTIVQVTHNMPFAEIGNRKIVLKDGEIIEAK